MAYKPILFSTQMILQLPQMGGNKSMTRRVCKNFPEGAHDFEYNEDGTLAIMAGSIENGVCWDGWKEVKPPYMVGDILWVRETYKIDYLSSGGCFGKIKYRADESYKDFCFSNDRWEMMTRLHRKPGWVPGRIMPKEAARFFVEVTAVRPERVQDISQEDAHKEGIAFRPPNRDWLISDFRELWDSLNAERGHGWDKNDWVYAYTFKPINEPKGWCLQS